MPKFTFENRWTMGNIIQIVVILATLMWGYATLSSAVTASSDKVAGLGVTVTDLSIRLPVVERNQVAGKEAREQFQVEAKATLELLRTQNIQILQGMSALTARLDERDRTAAR